MTTMIAQEDALAQVALPVLPKLAINYLLSASNIAEKLQSDAQSDVGRWVQNGYMRDLDSRHEWEQRNAEAIKLALQVVEVKSFPWTNCSNVKFPLVTIAALQFLARISILTKGRRLVKVESIGMDPDGSKAARASRINTHMSMQLTDEDINWVNDDEQAKFAASIVGSAFKKTRFDPVQGINVSEYVPAKFFVFDYFCKHINTATRATHVIPMDLNKIVEHVRRGIFIEEPEPMPAATGTTSNTNLLAKVSDEVEGTRSGGSNESINVLEQYCWLDLDGDGYAEPYVISVREDTGHLYRIVARFFEEDIHRVNDLAVQQYENLANAAHIDPKLPEEQQAAAAKIISKYEKEAQKLQDAKDNAIVRIDPTQYFTKYTFIPSPDGGAYGLGLGALLGPVNEATNTLINQLIDSGTMSNSGGGFLGRGVKVKGGKTRFDPFEWKPVDSTGDDLRKNIFPLPIREPSNVLFQLLGVLIQYGEKIGSATDIMTGVSPGQNTPAETSRNTVEQGMMLFSGIYARMYRSFREEISKLFALNRLFLKNSRQWWALTKGPDALIAEDDYIVGRFRIFPNADPSVVSGQQVRDRADRLVQASQSPIGAQWDKAAISRMWLEANEYSDIEQIFPDPTGPKAIAPPQNPKVVADAAKQKLAELKHHDTMMLAVADFKQEMALNEAKISELEAKAEMELKQADGIDKGHLIAMLDVQIGAAKARNETLMKVSDLMLRANVAKSGVEKNIHDMTMDVHDRHVAKSAMASDASAASPLPGQDNATGNQPNPQAA